MSKSKKTRNTQQDRAGKNHTGKNQTGQKRSQQKREGIVLLVVLSLLVLFVLVGVTYAIATRMANRSAKSHAKRDIRGDDPRKELDQAMYQILRGPASNVKSSLLGQSLLRDLYGNGVFGNMAAAPTVAEFSPAGGQVIRVDVPVRTYDEAIKFSPLRDFYAGSVFTVLDGPYPLRSTRVLRYVPLNRTQLAFLLTAFQDSMAPQATNNNIYMTFYLEAFDLTAAEHTALYDTMVANPPNASTGVPLRFVINGKPYSGTGYGYDPRNGNNRAGVTANINGLSTSPTAPVALLPHFAFGIYNDDYTNVDVPRGDANEGYDAPDFRNMFLAMVPVDANANFIEDSLIPSYHRPGLIQYMRTGANSSAWVPSTGYKTFRRQVIFRPMPWDHPNFTGSTPLLAGGTPNAGIDGNWGVSGVDDDNDGVTDNASEFLSENSDDYFDNDTQLLNRLTGNDPSVPAIYDVDNDGDGDKESIWLDPGFPIKTTPDGIKYKVLIAAYVVDLDGRININAAGNLAQAVQDLTTPNSKPSYLPDNRTRLYSSATAAGTLHFLDTTLPTSPGGNLPRGFGYGPAEINFRHLLDTPATANDFNNYQTFLNVRNGVGNRPGAAGVDELLSQVRNVGWTNYFSLSSVLGSPPDIFGASSFGLDNLGNPIFTYMTQDDSGANSAANQTVDDPYEKNLLSPSSNDALFTLAELERVLRRADIDAKSLPSRLAVALQTSDVGVPSTAARHGLVTTRSSYIPSLPLPPQPINFTADTNDLYDILYNSAGFNPTTRPAAIRRLNSSGTAVIAKHGSYPTILDLMAAKIYQQDPTVNIDTLNTRLRQLLPFELFHGQKMDVNRLWGDGVDNNGNGVVDEPGESLNSIWSGISGFNGTNPNFANNDPLFGEAAARQIFARQLYCMMLLMVDLDVQGTSAATRNFVQPLQEVGLSTSRQRFLTARRIAQWAVNVVDFRDPDAIMTPFLFDVNPYDSGGWNPVATVRENWVLGAEAPELLMTELVAFHDRRVRDTRDEASMGKTTTDVMMPDNDFDQYRLPQGSLFIELFCPRNRNNPAAPRELYDVGGISTIPRLRLDRTTPANGAGTVFPVWRIAISEFHPPVDSVQTKLSARQDSITPNPVDLNLLPGPTFSEPLPIDRVIWFTNGLTPTAANTPDTLPTHVFFRREAAHSAALRCGDYALLGPRENTYIGSQEPAASMLPGDTDVANQQIVLAPSQYNPASFFSANPTVSGRNEANVSFYPAMNAGAAQIKAPLTMIIASQTPTRADWADDTDGVTAVQALQSGKVGLSISEPLYDAYYPEPKVQTNPTHALTDGFRVYDPAGALFLPDQPFDERAGNPLATAPTAGENNGTFQDYKTAFLQRLANPLRPYNGNLVVGGNPNPNYNPYVTVDWSSIDLTVFNGSGPETGTPNFQFRTRRPPATPRKIWNTKAAPLATAKAAGTPDIFGHKLSSLGGADHTLGFLNQGEMGNRLTPSPANAATGDPNQPFPWLVWNNRPFANHLELMQVPASSAGRLTHEFNLNTGANPYGGATSPPTLAEFKGTYGHLLNFFHTTTDNGAGTRTVGKANYYRLLDFVETPSRYLGAERWYNPSIFATETVGSQGEFMIGYRPPFNKLSRFRDPGRINLNTISDYRVWEALTKGFFAQDPRFDPNVNVNVLTPSPNQITGAFSYWERFLISRRGGGSSFGTLPTQFGNPFRSVGAANLAPTAALRAISNGQDGIQATLLRNDTQAAADPLLDSDFTTQRALDATNNSGMQYHPISRLANMVSGQSNVYAVWLTVGYFEVTPGAVDRGHPDGYRLGAEIGFDTGEIRRHRGFYIIDRSIPVAFEPGKNHNVDNCVLLRRFIE